MELEIVHLYPDLLNTYGDLGNIKIIKNRAEARGIKVSVKNVTVGDRQGKCDLLFIGGGQDFEQTIAAEDMKNKRRDFIKGYIEDGGTALLVCGGYQLMGEYYTLPSKAKEKGLEILPIYTDRGEKRITGDIVVQSETEVLVGFENHSGRTYTGDLQPLGKVLYGNGNNGEDKKEGCIYKNTICTYMHGPLLSKNSALCDDIIKRAMIRKYGSCILEPLPDFYELEAKKVMIERLLKESV